MTNTLFDGLLAGRDPDRPFAFVPATGARLAYGDIMDLSARYAATLADRGVEPGDRIAVQVPKSIEALALYLAAVRAGAIFLPLNTAYTADEVEYFIGDAKPRIFFCDPEHESAYCGIAGPNGARLETFGEGGRGSFTDTLGDADFETVPRGPDDLAAILYTSGTTGRSKGAMLSHRNLLSNAETLVEAWHFTDDDRLLHALPIFHTHGLFVACNTAMRAGASLTFLPGFDADAIVEHLPESTVLMGVPTFYTRLLQRDDFDEALCGNMRLFTSGSAPLLAETHRAFEGRTGHRILERYGMTETNMNTSNPYDAERRAGTVGFPLPGVELRIVGEDGEDVARGEIGIIEVRGDNVCQGYWEMPEKTREEMREDGFFITGDLARQDEDGYVTIVGRAKDLIITGGFNVYPKEIEGIIDEIEGVSESAVVGVAHPDFGEGVVACIVGEDGLTEEGVLDAIAGKLAKFKQPKRAFFIDELPRNTMGKVQKNALRERFADTFSADDDPA